MQFTLDLPKLFEILAVLQGIIFSALLAYRAWTQQRYADYWLSALLLMFSCYLLRYVLEAINPDNNVLARVLTFSYYVIGVMIYFYLKSQINARFRLSRKDLWHFLPIFIYILLFFIHSFQTYQHGGVWQRPFVFAIFSWIFLMYRSIGTVIYWVLSWQLYQKYRLWLPTERSDTEGVKLIWFKNVLVTFGLLVFSGIALNLFDNFVFTTPIWLDTVQELVVAFGLYYISLSGYLQYQPQQLVFEEKTATLEEKEGTQNATILIAKMSEMELIDWRNKILSLIENDRLYLNPELTLTDLAGRLQTHSKLVSAVINASFEKNFNDFINEYRVNLFKEKANDPKLKHLTLLAIAFECGFNSKSTFNRAVKRVTGEMPSAFIK